MQEHKKQHIKDKLEKLRKILANNQKDVESDIMYTPLYDVADLPNMFYDKFQDALDIVDKLIDEDLD